MKNEDETRLRHKRVLRSQDPNTFPAKPQGEEKLTTECQKDGGAEGQRCLSHHQSRLDEGR